MSSAPVPTVVLASDPDDLLRQAEDLFSLIITHCVEHEERKYPERQRQEREHQGREYQKRLQERLSKAHGGQESSASKPYPEYPGPTFYKRAALVKLTHEHCVNKKAFVRYCFISFSTHDIAQPTDAGAINVEENSSEFERGVARFLAFTPESPALTERSQQSRNDSDGLRKEAREAVDNFAQDLVLSFYARMKAVGRVAESKTASISTPTADRMKAVARRDRSHQADCKYRDGYFCLITKMFDTDQYIIARKCNPDRPTDLDGNPLKIGHMAKLEVAHIIPHSTLTVLAVDQPLPDQKRTMMAVLGMFDPDSLPLLNDSKIDGPENALCLAMEAHESFGTFQIAFQAVEGAPPHTYKLVAFEDGLEIKYNLPDGPITLTSRAFDVPLPSPVLLKIHWAIAKILHLTGAGEYIEGILRDEGGYLIPADGSADIGCMISAKVNGWLQGVDPVFPASEDRPPQYQGL